MTLQRNYHSVRTIFFRAPSVLTAALILLISGCGGSSDQQGAAFAAPPLTVEVYEVERKNIDYTQTYSGRARASNEAQIRPQVSGIVKELLFDEGDFVEAGKPLYQIGTEEYEVALDRAQAGAEQASAEADLASSRVDRLNGLVEKDAISRQDYDSAVATMRSAKANYKLQLAAVRSAEINLERTTIKAPIAGTIGRSSVTEGALVTQNQQEPLALISQLDPIYVDLTIPSVAIIEFQEAVKNGTVKSNNDISEVTAQVLFENDLVYDHTGTLSLVEVRVEESSGSVTGRATVPNPEGRILPGMFLKSRLKIGQFQQAITVPQRAVIRTPRGQQAIYIVGADNKVEQVSIQTIRTFDDKWIVTGPMQNGDQIIVSNLQKMQPGIEVTVANNEQNSGS